MVNEIEKLIDLARDRSSAARRRLVENITDLFLSDEGRLSEHERALMTDILAKLVQNVEKEIRRELADSLAKSEIDLPELVRMLSNDEIEVARPLLEKSKVLQDVDLIEIVKMRTDEHRLAIAFRDELSEPVTDALIEYGNDDVVEALLRNSDASLSKRAMEYLVAESRRVDRFQEPLVKRSDLPSVLAYRMYWWVSAALRKRILQDFDIDPLYLDRSIKRAADAVLVTETEDDGAHVKAQRLVRRMAETGDLTLKFLMDALQQRRIAVFVAGIAELGNINFKTAWRIFSDRGGDSFAVLARAIGMERNQFTTIYLLLQAAREGEKAQAPQVLNRILELFDSVSQENARGALQYWQQDSAFQQAIEELEHVR